MIHTRTFRPVDLLAVADVDREVFPEVAYPIVALRQAHDVFGSLFRVAEDPSSGLVGYAVGAVAEETGTGWLLALGVRRAWRRDGVGRTLTTEIIGLLRGRPISKILLTVDPENEAAIALYRDLGFTAGEAVEEYFGDGQDRLMMSLDVALRTTHR